MRRIAMIVVALCAAATATASPLEAAPAGPPQAELDHIVGRVNDRIITQSDVREARALRLVDDPSSDDAARVCLENRLLILGEIATQTAQTAGQPPGSPGMIAVLVGEDNRADPLQRQARGLGAPLDLTGAEPGVDQHGEAVHLHRAAVAARARAQHEERRHLPRARA